MISLSLFNFRKRFLIICIAFISSQVIASNEYDLKEIYEEIEEQILNNDYGLPLYLESIKKEDSMRGDVYGIIYHPYETVSKNLASLTNWCGIMPQHLNIKACTYQYVNDQCRLIFYTGRKFYEKADNVYHLNYRFKVSTLNNNYFNAFLDSKEGPLDTTDYVITVEAIPLTDNSTFFHLAYEYKYGFWAHIAMSTYFSTLGRKKVGFTIEGKDKKGNALYVKGIRGVIERNSIRYYFAIQSFLDTLNIPLETRFKARISNWFDLTEKHHKQLYEMDKEDYLKYKKMERQNQNRLQKEIDINKDQSIAQSNSITTCLSIN